MSDYLLFEDENWEDFLPLIYLKPLSELRIGMSKIREKWELALGQPVGFSSTNSERNARWGTATAGCQINARIMPDEDLVQAILTLKDGEALVTPKLTIASVGQSISRTIAYPKAPICLEHITDIFTKNHLILTSDFSRTIPDVAGVPVHPSTTIIGDPSLIYLEAGASILASTINTTEGPVWIGKDAQIMEGCQVRGPFYLGEHAQLKMGTRVYGATTIGPHCKVGGEISNSVIQGFSNKAHDGFLGNSLLGEWCNLGADTNNSNLKNNYAPVKIWNYKAQQMISTNLTFCGLIMGDHSKSGINTMFNTGTVVGVGSNIFGGGFPPTFIPSFSWGGADGFEVHQLDKMIQTAERVLARRNLPLHAELREMLTQVFHATSKERIFATHRQ